MRIKINNYEEAFSDKQGSAYLVVNTDRGMMSCWDAEVCEGIKKNVGNFIDATYKTNTKGYTTIYSFVADGSPAPVSTYKNVQGDKTTIRPDYSSGARIGCALNNAVALAVSGKLAVNAEDTDIMQPIARAAHAFVMIMKELEK